MGKRREQHVAARQQRGGQPRALGDADARRAEQLLVARGHLREPVGDIRFESGHDAVDGTRAEGEGSRGMQGTR